MLVGVAGGEAPCFDDGRVMCQESILFDNMII
jgi:hypothetical protein